MSFYKKYKYREAWRNKETGRRVVMRFKNKADADDYYKRGNISQNFTRQKAPSLKKKRARKATGFFDRPLSFGW